MADKIPVKAIYTLADVTSLGEFNPGDTIPIANGGTGAVNAIGARTNLGLASMAMQESNNVEITGGTIDGTVIGGTTPAAGSFTALSATGGIGLNNGNTVAWGGLGSSVYIDGSAASNTWEVVTENAQRVLVSNSGLSVTGALSASGDVSIPSNKSYKLGATSYVYSDGNGVVEIASAGAAPQIKLVVGGVVGATLDAAGNLGLGVTPSAWSSSDKAIDGYGGLGFSISSTNSLFLNSNAYRNASSGWTFKTSNPAYMFGVAGNGPTSGYQWLSSSDAITTAGNEIHWRQDMTLDASGNLLLNATSISANTDSLVFFARGAIKAVHSSGTASGTQYAIYSYAGTDIGSITQSGTTAVAYNTTSDPRLKTNVRPANASRFNDIEFVDFEWIDGRHDCGVLAPQLQSVYPDLVTGKAGATEIRAVEISPAIPAVTEQVLVTEAVLNDDGEEIEPAVYETVEITPAVPAVMEDQEFPVYQQVNYQGLIGRMGTRIQIQDKLIQDLLARVEALEAA